jgi:hypothetical protein
VPTPAIFGPAGRTFRKPCLIDEPLGFAQSCGVHEDYVLLFRCGLEEIASPAHQGGELVTTAERDALLQRTIHEIPAAIEAYDEQSQSKTQALKRGRAAKRRRITRLKRCSNRTHPGARTLSRERGYEL